MSVTLPISVGVSRVVSSFTVTSILRADNNQAPIGTTLPVTLTVGSPVAGVYPWTGSFVDSTSAPFYNAIGMIDGESFPFVIQGTTAPSGLWATLANVQQIYGPDNIFLWSQNATSATPSATWQQGAFTRADQYILQEFSSYYFVPPTVNSTLTWIEAELVGVYLYEANGLQDAAKGIDGKMTAHRENAENQLEELFFQNRGGFTHTSGYRDAIQGVLQTVSPGGNPIQQQSPWPLPYFTGYQWVWGNTPGVLPIETVG